MKEKNIRCVPNKVFLEHFRKCGYAITESYEPHTIEALEKLSFDIAENYNVTRKFVSELVSVIANGDNTDKSFSYNLPDKAKTRADICDLARKLHSYGVLQECKIHPNNISGTVTKLVRVRQFITGQWLEIYASSVIRDTVKAYAESNNLPYQILSNVKLEVNRITVHEIDCCFTIGNTVYATEQKSGKNFNDYYHLHEIGKDLGIVPDHYLLLNANLIDEEKTEILEYMNQFYICNTDTLKQKLLKMISST